MNIESVFWPLVSIAALVVFCWRVGWWLGLSIFVGFVAVFVAQKWVFERFDAPVQWLFTGAVVVCSIGIARLLLDDEDDYEDDYEGDDEDDDDDLD